jgi:outer membrane biosynthesis protein TonB
MKLRWWSRPEPEPELQPEPEPEPEPEPQPEPQPEPAVVPEPAAPTVEAEPPGRVSLTLDEAKEAIRAAKGDVIQVGFLAGDYKRHQEEDPGSGETAAARAQLCELIAKRLRDRKLLAPDGVFELREGP